MVAGLLALLLGFTPAAAQPDSTPFDRFAFHYQDSHGNGIDTIDGAITRDNCDWPPSRGHVRLTRKQLRLVYDRLMLLQAFELHEPYPALDRGLRDEAAWTRVDIRAGSTLRHFEWGGSGPGVQHSPEWERLL
jgi:hypothetical protein